MSKYLYKVFADAGVNVSANMLRHIYLTEKYGSESTYCTRLVLKFLVLSLSSYTSSNEHRYVCGVILRTSNVRENASFLQNVWT